MASTLLALMFMGSSASAQSLVGHWKVKGSNSKGPYKGDLTVTKSGAALKLSYEAVAADGSKTRLLGEFKSKKSRNVSIVATKLKVRAAPKTGEVKDFLFFGDVVPVTKEAAGWLQIRYKNQDLWISKSWTKPVASVGNTIKFTMKLPRGLASRLGEGLGATEESSAGTYKGEFQRANKDQWTGTLTGPENDVRSETWSRVPKDAAGQGATTFVLKGTDRPIANSIIVLAVRDGGLLKAKHTLKTNAAGIASLPEALPEEGEFETFFLRRKEDFSRRPESKTDMVKVSDLKGEEDKEVGLRYFGPRWKTEYEHMLTVKDIVGSGGFRWNSAKKEWDTPILDCITSAFYAVAAATDLGNRGIYKPPSVDNMLRDKRGRPMVVNSCFKNVLTPVWGNNETMARLATSGSVYRGVCRWPWKSMRWGWTGTSDCGCGAHVTPATIMNNVDKLGKINILSMSQAKRPKGPDYGPMSGWTMRYEYSVLVLIKRDDGSLYCYHASTSHSPRKRCKTFKDEVEYWGVDSYGSKQTDVRYLVWKADDSQIDPFFWLDENGQEFTPEHIIEDLRKQSGKEGSTYPQPIGPQPDPNADGEGEGEGENGNENEGEGESESNSESNEGADGNSNSGSGDSTPNPDDE